MPDHMHFFCAPRTDAKTLSDFMRRMEIMDVPQIRWPAAAASDRSYNATDYHSGNANS